MKTRLAKDGRAVEPGAVEPGAASEGPGAGAVEPGGAEDPGAKGVESGAGAAEPGVRTLGGIGSWVTIHVGDERFGPGHAWQITDEQRSERGIRLVVETTLDGVTKTIAVKPEACRALALTWLVPGSVPSRSAPVLTSVASRLAHSAPVSFAPPGVRIFARMAINIGSSKRMAVVSL